MIKGIPESVKTSNLNNLIRLEVALKTLSQQVFEAKSMLTDEYGTLAKTDPETFDKISSDMQLTAGTIRDYTFNLDEHLSYAVKNGEFESDLIEEKIVQLRFQDALEKRNREAREVVFGKVQVDNLPDLD